MRQKKSITFSMLMVLAMFATASLVMAQDAKPRKSPKATVSQRIGADTDIVIASARAYVNALNKIFASAQQERKHPQQI